MSHIEKPKIISEKDLTAQTAVETLISWAGFDKTHPSVKKTPARVLKAYREMFAGYHQDGPSILKETCMPAKNSDHWIMVRGIPFFSHCEHHMLPIVGKVFIGYQPGEQNVQMESLLKLVDCYARRLQIQEKFNAQLVNDIVDILNPAAVAVLVEAEHHCMTTRGVHKKGVSMVTKRLHGPVEESRLHSLYSG